MTATIDYYFAPNSPWTYLGHQRFAEIAAAAGAKINVLPVDLGGKVFPVSGGLPLAKRAPQRLAYRLVELKRFGEYHGRPINLQPAYFPVSADDAAKLIIAVDLNDGTEAAMELTGASCAACGSSRRTSPTRANWPRCWPTRACRRAASTTRCRRRCTSATSRTRSARSRPACSAHRAT